MGTNNSRDYRLKTKQTEKTEHAHQITKCAHAQQMSLNSYQSCAITVNVHLRSATATTPSPPTQKIIQIFRIHPEEKTSTIKHLPCATTFYIILCYFLKKKLYLDICTHLCKS